MPTVFAPGKLGPLEWKWNKTCIFGVVNVTPDSFFDGGKYFDTETAIEHGLRLALKGADVLDVGGESTRPHSEPVPEEEELKRVIPVIQGIASRSKVPISIDTYKSRVAREAVLAGAGIINDISGMLLDEKMAEVAAETDASLVIGHLRGKPASMQENISFKDVVTEVIEELKLGVRRAVIAGVKADRIWIDPCIGFGKTAEQSLELLRETQRVREEIGYPLLIGPSRKSFISAVTGEPPEERFVGTCAAVCAAIAKGADGIRIHDVAEMMPAIRVADAIRRGLP